MMFRSRASRRFPQRLLPSLLVHDDVNFPQEKVYPQRVSAQFYKLFLDTSVSAQLSEYDALAIIEHDVRVVYRNSFAQLYREAFCGIEEFWVKGSVVEEGGDMWHAVGHINRNAIYNNDDPAFVEYVEYARARWGDYYPYDVALWATISDFPYSWQLWQKYSSKFLVANLVRIWHSYYFTVVVFAVDEMAVA